MAVVSTTLWCYWWWCCNSGGIVFVVGGDSAASPVSAKLPGAVAVSVGSTMNSSEFSGSLIVKTL
jgi:hypothetical protein